MHKRSYCIIGLELYMEDFSPIDVYEKLGLRPTIYKHKSAKEVLNLSYGNWRAELEQYLKACENLTQASMKQQADAAQAAQTIDLAPDPDSSLKELCTAGSPRDFAKELKDEPKAFYKIHSKKIAPTTFRRECERFVERIDHKQKILEHLREVHNAFIVLKIHAYINKKDSLALNLSPKVSQVCARLGVRILTHIEVL